MKMMVTAALFLFLAKPYPGQWALSDGTQVSAIFVKPSEKLAWRIDGTPLDLRSLPKPIAPTWSGKDSDPILVALTNLTGNPSLRPTVQFKLPATTIVESSFTTQCQQRRIWISGYYAGHDQPAEQDIAIGVASGPWTVVGWVDYKKSGSGVAPTKQGGLSFKPEVAGKSTTGPFTMVDLPTPRNSGSTITRIVVRNHIGGELSFAGSNPVSGREGVTNYLFNGDVQSVARVELQVRPIQWHTIKVAHFKPVP